MAAYKGVMECTVVIREYWVILQDLCQVENCYVYGGIAQTYYNNRLNYSSMVAYCGQFYKCSFSHS